MRNNKKSDIDASRMAVERNYNVTATFIEAMPVSECYEGKIVWEGSVYVFKIEGHPKAVKCYAWPSLTKEGKKRYYTVLHIPPIDSPDKAVKASIIYDHKTGYLK